MSNVNEKQMLEHISLTQGYIYFNKFHFLISFLLNTDKIHKINLQGFLTFAVIMWFNPLANRQYIALPHSTRGRNHNFTVWFPALPCRAAIIMSFWLLTHRQKSLMLASQRGRSETLAERTIISLITQKL